MKQGEGQVFDVYPEDRFVLSLLPHEIHSWTFDDINQLDDILILAFGEMEVSHAEITTILVQDSKETDCKGRYTTLLRLDMDQFVKNPLNINNVLNSHIYREIKRSFQYIK